LNSAAVVGKKGVGGADDAEVELLSFTGKISCFEDRNVGQSRLLRVGWIPKAG
jgi:hypothetical protein